MRAGRGRFGVGSFVAGIALATIVSGCVGVSSTAPPSSSSTAGVALAHFRGYGVEFDYPAGWNTFGPPALAWGETAVTNGSVPDSCCADYRLAPGTLFLGVLTMPYVPWGASGTPPAFPFDRMIGGSPAYLEVRVPTLGLDEHIAWYTPGVNGRWYIFQLALEGPGIEQLKAQAGAVLDTVRFFPTADLTAPPSIGNPAT